MELAFMVPLLSEIFKDDGSFMQKIFVGVFLLIGIHFMGRNHIKLITKEMKSIKEEMSKGFSAIREVHDKHEVAIFTLQQDVKKVKESNVIQEHEVRITRLEESRI